MRSVVYWVRPINLRYPRIVGVYWGPNGNQELFFGIVYPDE